MSLTHRLVFDTKNKNEVLMIKILYDDNKEICENFK